MINTYVLGVSASIAAGIVFNVGMLVQKVAVKRAKEEAGLMRQLIRSRLWMAGFIFQFIIGTPLNMLGQAIIGPALIPGLMAIGLVVLAIGAVRLGQESLGPPDVIGIFLVICAIAFCGLSRLGVDLQTIDIYSLAFLSRLVAFSIGVAALSIACYLPQRRATRWLGVLRILDAGLLFAQSNIWLGILMIFPTRWSNGLFLTRDLLLAGIASAVTLVSSALGVIETQRAFRVGDAARLVPIQAIPQQILPLVSYFAVFGLTPPNQGSLFFAGAAAALILLGSALLARRQASMA